MYPGRARKYVLASVHSRWNASSRSSGTVKQWISVTGPVTSLASVAVRDSGVMVSVIALTPRCSLHTCVVTTRMYTQARADVKGGSSGRHRRRERAVPPAASHQGGDRGR